MKNFVILILEILLEFTIFVLDFYVAITWFVNNYFLVVVDSVLTAIIITSIWYFVLPKH